MNSPLLKSTIPHLTSQILPLLFALCFTGNGWASDALEKAARLEQQGQFREAAVLLTNAMHAATLPATDRKTLEFESDRLNRIKQDFPFTQEQLFAELKKSVKDLTAQEYQKWVAEGRFDSRMIDGQRY